LELFKPAITIALIVLTVIGIAYVISVLKNAEIASTYLHPGARIAVVGRIGLERVRDALESLAPKEEEAEVIAFEKMLGSGESGS
jgi:single-stranded DNA-binding protein